MRSPSSVSRSSAALAVVMLAPIVFGAAADATDATDAADAIPGNELVEVPAGTFIFGRDGGRDNEGPQAEVDLPAFRMLRTEVTNDQYGSFVIETGRGLPAYAGHPILGKGNHPVVGVSWQEADGFCRHNGLTLPSEEQYERAARGPKGGLFPWGDDGPGPQRVNRGAPNCCGGDDDDGYFWTAPVGAFPQGASVEGIVDLIGNAWEWTRDWYAPYDGPVDPEIAEKFRVLRGGSWSNSGERLSTTYRLAYDPDFRFAANGGFRCVAPAF